MNSVNVMTARPGDFLACMACFPMEWGGTTSNYGMTRIGKAIAEDRLLVGVVDDLVVGVLEWSEAVFENVLYLGITGTHPDYRRRGIGMALLLKAIEIAKSKNVRAVLGDTIKSNNASVEGVKKVGFREIGQVHDLVTPGETSVFMQLIL